MNVFILSHTVAGCAYACSLYRVVEAFAYPEQVMYRPHDPIKVKLPQSGNVEREAVIKLQESAIRLLVKSTLCYLLLIGFMHAYGREHERLVADRDAALQQTPPYHCQGNDQWSDVPWTKAIQMAIMPSTAEAECANYLARIHRSVWANPLYVLVDIIVLVPMRWVDAISDSVGASVAHFLSHFSFLLQGYFLLLIPLLVIVWMWSIPVSQFFDALRRNYTINTQPQQKQLQQQSTYQYPLAIDSFPNNPYLLHITTDTGNSVDL